MKTVQIGNKTIGHGCSTFVMAEIGINHNGDAKTAERLVKEAARCGADAVKIQTYITEKRVSKDSAVFDILKRCELSNACQANLKSMAEGLGLAFLSTPFDEESVDFLASLGIVAYKIASFDLVNLLLLRKVASMGRPVIASRGMATKMEIDNSIRVLEAHKVPYALLHCISSYPTPRNCANLNVIRALFQNYDCPVGYSDHTLGIDVPIHAVAAGACVIEKHFTLDKSMSGPDHQLSADPGELAGMVRRIRDLEEIMGQSEFAAYESEQGTLIYRRPTS